MPLPRHDPPCKVLLLETRDDGVADDPLGGRIVEHTFEAITDLDSQRTVIFGDDEDDALMPMLARTM